MSRFDSQFRDCLRDQAMSTGDRRALERSWCIAPEPEKVPVAVKILVAAILIAGVALILAPSVARVWL